MTYAVIGTPSARSPRNDPQRFFGNHRCSAGASGVSVTSHWGGQRRRQDHGKDDAAIMFLLCSHAPAILPTMPDANNLTPADPSDLAAALAFALRYQGRKRVHNADEIMAEIVAKRLVEHLERAVFVVMKRPPEIGAAALGRGHS